MGINLFALTLRLRISDIMWSFFVQLPAQMETKELNNYTNEAIDLLVTHGPRVIMAIVVLIAGLWIIGMVTKGVYRTMTKSKMDPSLTPFLRSLISVTLKILLLVSVVGMVGIEVTSFIAVIGAAGLAVGLALQGTLQNFAGGVVILVLKPFEVGHFIEGAGHSGTVHGIQIFNTILKTPDNVTIVVPNGQLANSAITNYSAEKNRRLDLVFGIGYGDDAAKARQVLSDIIQADDRIHQEPKPFIALTELADSSVNFTIRVWVTASDYWPTKFDLIEKVYVTFTEKGINIPFPQMDVHVHQN